MSNPTDNHDPVRESLSREAVVCHDPVFILTASRSGSTLLRFILDTHPEFACPPETMITIACVSLLRSCDILENAGSGNQRLVTEHAQLSADALDTVRGTVDRVFGRYLAQLGKPRWCDKSLDSIFNAGLLAELYPEARFVCLYRHCMDVIASGVEVCPWGLSRFGFDGFVAQNPGNSVAAIGSYWADCARAMLAFEEDRSDRCHRVRYEDLVTAPEEVTAGLLQFLGARPAPGITTRCFDTPHEGDGPGDEKIWFTTRITADAMGRGVRVPAAALPPPVREQINELLGKLSYRPVTEDWNNAPNPLDPRLPDVAKHPGETIAFNGGPANGGAANGGAANGGPANGGAANGGAANGGPANGAAATAQAVAPAVRALAERLQSRTTEDPESITALWPALAGQSVRLVVTAGSGQHDELNWTFPKSMPDGSHTDDDRAAESGRASETSAGPVATMIAEPHVWLALLDGKANMITEVRAGRVRCVNRRDEFRVRSDEVHAIAWLLGLAQVPLVRANAEAVP